MTAEQSPLRGFVKNGRFQFQVKAIPRSRKSEIAGLRNGALLVKVAAAPEKGKANAELSSCIARSLGIPSGAVEVERGQGSRDKSVSIPAECEEKLRSLAGGKEPSGLNSGPSAG